ncbi:rhomboid family intramembrane serine protease [Wenjunlia tyrosinilytica]|uniref:Rhomboid family intramembrane serine protease n=1 Tax=Wenjunlia tyrosinilytica TaxID=1544741 RepID=A0A917ZH25_9ACTN|nr:rhomboid family intramembrane serine protease [Wenjunlia tyrosinilytica]GGO82009.1 rhomboid family intramembrane serine protease [Wenjunlia tyrosinilytica]
MVTSVPSRPWVTYALIAANCAVFLAGPAAGPVAGTGTGTAQMEQEAYFHRWGVVPVDLLANERAGSVLTAMFVHGSWLHLLGNALFLHVFGARLEGRLGHLHFAVFYLAAGTAATYGYALGHADSRHALIGASGAIAGVLGAYLCLYPRARVTSLVPALFFLPLRFPAWLVLGVWFALQWLALRAEPPGPGIAHLAHVAGFAAGFAYAWARYRRADTLGGAARANRGDSQP